MENKKKILFNMWSFSLGGGAEKILSTIINNLDLNKYDVDILEMEQFDKGYEPIPSIVNIKKFSSYKYPYLIRSLLWKMRIHTPNIVRKLLVKDIYDIEISFTVMNPPLNFSKRKNVKKIAWIHGSIESYLEHNNKGNKDRYGKYLDTADIIVAISKKTKQSIIDVFPQYEKKIELVYNGYDFNDIENKSLEACEIKIENNSICAIGRIEHNKGSDRVLDVLRLLHDANKKYHLYFIGSGELQKVLENRVKEYSLEKYVHFLGYKKNPYKYLKNMDCLISMSKQEGFPGVYVESLALGVPFVSTDVGGAEELSSGGYGDIVYSNTEAVEKIVERVENLQEKSEMKNFIRRFSLEENTNNIRELLEGTKDIV